MELCKQIFLLRHLKTVNNDLHIISGQSNSEIIKTECTKVDMSRYDKIYCSPLLRCKKTIELLAKESIDTSEIFYDKRLIERDMGELEGISKRESIYKYPDLFIEGGFNVFQTPPKGEDFKCFKYRVKEFYNEYLCTNEKESILICSHNQTLKLLRLLFLKKEITYQSWMEYSFRNGEIEELMNINL